MSENERGGIGVIDRSESRKPIPPRRYKVVYHNDDYTPMDFVVWSLMSIFNKSKEEANMIMIDVHEKGKGIAGVYDYQIAEQKIYQVSDIAKKHDFPLQVTGEPE